MNKLLRIFPFVLAASFLLVSCAASTGNRYEKDEEHSNSAEKPKDEKKTESFKEDFDLSRYREKIDIDYSENSDVNIDDLNIWYEYPHTDTASISKKIIGQAEGYRVQVFTSDNLSEADSLKSELYFVTNQKDVYVIFEPPFYKVRVGDFQNMSDATTLNFKLTQMGYSDSRVVKDSVNIFEQY